MWSKTITIHMMCDVCGHSEDYPNLQLEKIRELFGWRQKRLRDGCRIEVCRKCKIPKWYSIHEKRHSSGDNQC